jgi:hypothetical protein
VQYVHNAHPNYEEQTPVRHPDGFSLGWLHLQLTRRTVNAR